MSRIRYIGILKEFAIKFKKEGNIVEMMQIQGELASIATGFRTMSPKDQEGFCEKEIKISEAALDALKAIEKEKYHAGVITLQNPTELGKSIVEVLYTDLGWDDIW